jgi:hypothetical protein
VLDIRLFLKRWGDFRDAGDFGKYAEWRMGITMRLE